MVVTSAVTIIWGWIRAYDLFKLCQHQYLMIVL